MCTDRQVRILYIYIFNETTKQDADSTDYKVRNYLCRPPLNHP